MFYDDLVTKQGSKLGKQVWACDCGHQPIGGSIKFGLFHVIKPVDGLCPRCRHYAIHITEQALLESGGVL